MAVEMLLVGAELADSPVVERLSRQAAATKSDALTRARRALFSVRVISFSSLIGRNPGARGGAPGVPSRSNQPVRFAPDLLDDATPMRFTTRPPAARTVMIPFFFGFRLSFAFPCLLLVADSLTPAPVAVTTVFGVVLTTIVWG